MVRKFSQLQRIDKERKIILDTDRDFIYSLEHSVLLALKENGTINMIQYQYAAEKLKEQLYSQVKSIIPRDGSQ